MTKFGQQTRFSFVIILLLIPILLLGWFFIEQSKKDIAFAQKELDGLSYLGVIVPILTQVTADKADLDKQVRVFLDNRSLFDDVFGSSAQSLPAARLLEAGKIDTPESRLALTALMSHVGDHSNLILDPDLDSYYLMDAIVLRMPKVLTQLDTFSAELADRASQPTSNLMEDMRISISAVRLKDMLLDMRTSFAAAVAANKDGTVDKSLTQRVQAMIDYVERGTTGGLANRASSEALLVESNAFRDFESSLLKRQMVEAYQRASANLATLLSARINRFENRLQLALSLCVIVAVIALYFAVSVFRSILSGLDERILFLAHHDVMTRLKNRASFSASVDRMVRDVARNNSSFAIHVVDLDGFKAINDTFGHQAGDRVLKAVAERLMANAGEGDSVGRFGGDEFVVLQAGVTNFDSVQEYAQRLVKSLRIVIDLSGGPLQPSASIGSSIHGLHGNDEASLMRRADTALYYSKTQGKNRATIFNFDMELEQEQRLAMEREVRLATENKTFTLVYQPQFDVRGQHVSGFEALLRLTSQSGEAIPPIIFIPVVEKLGLVSEVGAWVLHRACQTAVNWPEHIQVAVNLSPLQFHTGDVVSTIGSALQKSGLPPGRLQVEITESVILESTDLVLRDLNRIKDLGVSIAMDDFGTGYSSLAYLWKFPFDKIKIDKSFVASDGLRPKHAKNILRTIISLGHSMSMSVTVEGVETPEQALTMIELDCDQVQGFHYGRPICERDLSTFMLQKALPRPGDGAGSISSVA